MIDGIGPTGADVAGAILRSRRRILAASQGELERVPWDRAGAGAGQVAGWEQTVDLSGELRRIKEYG